MQLCMIMVNIVTYTCSCAIGQRRVGSPSHLLVTREPARPLALEEEDGFGQGIAVIRTAMNTNHQGQEQGDNKRSCHGHNQKMDMVG